MVGSLVRFLFTSCEESQTNERVFEHNAIRQIFNKHCLACSQVIQKLLVIVPMVSKDAFLNSSVPHFYCCYIMSWVKKLLSHRTFPKWSVRILFLAFKSSFLLGTVIPLQDDPLPGANSLPPLAIGGILYLVSISAPLFSPKIARCSSLGCLLNNLRHESTSFLGNMTAMMKVTMMNKTAPPTPRVTPLTRILSFGSPGHEQSKKLSPFEVKSAFLV